MQTCVHTEDYYYISATLGCAAHLQKEGVKVQEGVRCVDLLDKSHESISNLSYQ